MQTQNTIRTAEPMDAPQAKSNGFAPGGRLVVLVREVAEPALLANRIHQAALAARRDVLLIGVVLQAPQESSLRRNLALLAAFVRGAGSQTETRVERGLDWTDALLLTDEDLLACGGDDYPLVDGRPWVDLLSSRFQRTVYAFTDASQVNPRRPRFTTEVSPWLASVAVIGSFTWLQVRLSLFGESPVITTALILSVLVEVGVVLLCNALIG